MKYLGFENKSIDVPHSLRGQKMVDISISLWIDRQINDIEAVIRGDMGTEF